MKRYILFFLIVAVMILGSSSSCNKSNEITITVLGENSSNLNAMESLKSEYEKTTGVKIEFKPNTFEEAFNKANQDFVNKTALYDVVMQYNFSLSSFVKNGYVYKLSELSGDIDPKELGFEKDLFENGWNEVGYYYKNPDNPDEGIEKIAYPFAVNTMMLVYNKQLFEDPVQKENYRKAFNEELVPPTDWKQYEKIAKFFTQPDKGVHGVSLQGSTGSWLYYEFLNFIWGFGGQVMKKTYGWEGDENTPVTLNTPNVLQALKFYKSLKPYNAGNFVNVDGPEQQRIFKEGKVAMIFMWSDYAFSLVEGETGRFSDKYGFLPMIGGKSPLGGGSYFINKNSKNPKEALKYILYLEQKDQQIKLLKQGLCSANKAAYDDPDVQKLPYAAALKKSLENGVYMLEAGPEADKVNNIMTTYLQKVWNDEITPEKALELMQNEVIAARKEIFSR